MIIFLINSNLLSNENLNSNILKNLRCLVCQGQTILDSNADFALIIKEVVNDKIEEGLSENEIYNFLSEKYGDWIFLNPPLKKDSYVIDSVFKLLTLPIEKENNYYENKAVNLPENYEKIESVELKNICFKYTHSESNTIDDLSITFHKGKSYAIVGSSGSGKSTLIDIFLNLLHPQEGKVLINGKHLMDTKNGGDYVTTFLRSNTLLLGQNDFYTGNRIKHLLELDAKEIKINNLEEKLEYGISSLNLKNIFERGGLDAFIGENGSKISGGQRQRLLILKAFLSNKSVFIFDEATSSLDSYSKKLVTNLLFTKSFFTPEKTLIFSTHSDSVSKLCNQTIRMN